MTEAVSTSTGEIEVFSDDSLKQSLEILNNGGSGGNMFSTIRGADRTAKLATLNAVTSSTPVSESLNKTIQVANVIVQKIDMEDEETKQMKPQPRIVLIDVDGKAYHAISGGLYRSIENILGIFGTDPAEWGGPIPLTITQEGSGNRKYFTARVELDKVAK